jgi:hypothetical protein
MGVAAAIVVHRRATGDGVEPRRQAGVLLEVADVAEGAEPDFLQDVGRVLLMVDQPTEKVVEAIVPVGDELIPRGQVATTAANDEQFVADLLAGTFDGVVLRLIR